MHAKPIIVLIVILLSIIGGIYYFQYYSKQNLDDLNVKNMQITSPEFRNNQSIPAKFTCDGDNVNPELNIAEVPAEAKSLVLIMDDPDAPMGTWIHWTAWNIDPSIDKIEENTFPIGSVQGITSSNKSGYGGPCPPSGTHRYFFKVYALDTKIDIEANSGVTLLEKTIEPHVIAKAELIGLYSRE